MPTVAEELIARCGPRFWIVDDPLGARHVVALRLATGAGRAAGPALFGVHRVLRELTGHYGPRSVDLPEAATADPHRYSTAFGAKVRFGRPAALLRLPAGLLSRPVGGPPPERSELAWRVRHTLSERLGGGTATLADVAREVAVHPRTLQRALIDEGLTFAEILDCVRRERAHAYLTGTRLPLAEISRRLDLAEPAVLSRCARRWWGRTPSAVRAGSAVVPAGSGLTAGPGPRVSSRVTPPAAQAARQRG